MSAQHEPGPAGGRALDGIEDHRRRVRPVRAFDDARPGPFGPCLELLSGGGSERVACSEQDRAARLCLPQGELPDRRRLADPVHPDEEPHRGTVVRAEGERADVTVEHRDEVGLQRLQEGRRVRR